MRIFGRATNLIVNGDLLNLQRRGSALAKEGGQVGEAGEGSCRATKILSRHFMSSALGLTKQGSRSQHLAEKILYLSEQLS